MKTIFILTIVLFSLNCEAQKYLQCDTFIVAVSAVDMINNNVRYDQITATDTIGIIEYVPNIWQFIETKIVLNDVGKALGTLCIDKITELLATEEKFKNCIIDE